MRSGWKGLRPRLRLKNWTVRAGRSPKITSGILEASESTRLRMEESLPNYHEDHIAGKGDNSLQHYNLVHKFIPCLKPSKFQQQRQQWTRNGKT